MKLLIERAKPIKPSVIRFTVYTASDDDIVNGEYDIALDIEGDVTVIPGEDKTEIKVDAASIQQRLTEQIAAMQLTGAVAAGFNGLQWIAEEEKEVENEELPTDTERK
jgi:hypothetical protein